MHRLPEASEAFEKALTLNDKVYKVWGNLADSYQYAGATSKAQTAYLRAVELAESAVKSSPQDTALEATLGYFYARIHKREKALVRIQSTLALGSDDPEALRRVASVYEALGMRKQATEYTKKALKKGYSLDLLKHSYNLGALLEDPAFYPEQDQSRGK